MDKRAARSIILICAVAVGTIFIVYRPTPNPSSRIPQQNVSKSTNDASHSKPSATTEDETHPTAIKAERENAGQQAMLMEFPSVVKTAIPPNWEVPGIPPQRKAHKFKDPEAGKDLIKILNGCLAFFREHAEVPIGTNAEITKQILDDNAKNRGYLERSTIALNDKGELLDRWGTPYFFHQFSKSYLEVRSAGPDKKLWTEDDEYL